jgi:release factor glutamine methyltransferase
MTTIAAALDAATAVLRADGFDTPRLDAEVLLRSVLGLDRTALFVRLPEVIEPEKVDRFTVLIDQRRAGVPVAYLVGERGFMGLPFAVGPAVLVPRPETEALVEWAARWLSSRPDRTVVDVGTGSGAIAVGLARHVPGSWAGRIVGSDISAAALDVAAANRRRLGAQGRLSLVRGDLLEWCGGPVDLILANLPYLRPSQVAENHDLAAEPALALVGGDDGLGLIRRLVADAPRLLALGGALGVEIDPSQVEAVVALVSAAFPRAAVAVQPDLAGLPRHVVAEV